MVYISSLSHVLLCSCFLFFCSRTSYDSPVIMKAYRDLNQSLKAIFDLALICLSKLFLVLSPFCNLYSSQIEYLKSDRDPTLTSGKPFFVTSPLLKSTPICACWNLLILKGSIQMLSLPWSLPWFPSQIFPLLNSLYSLIMSLQNLVTLCFGCCLSHFTSKL